MSEEAYGVDLDDLEQLCRSVDVNAGFYSHFQSEDGNEEHEDDSDDDEDDEEDDDEDYVPSVSSSTVAVISAAKSSPLLNLSSSAVQNLSNTELVQMSDSGPDVLLIQGMVQAILLSSVQPLWLNLNRS
jgi:hypothetical protein